MSCRKFQRPSGLYPTGPYVSSGEEVYSERNICGADPGYFELFSFQFIKGNPATALAKPNSVVLCRDQATKYFGSNEALGQVLEFDGRDKYTVTGVIENIGENTHLDYDMVVPFETIYIPGSPMDSWYDHFTNTYIMEGTDVQPDSLNAKLTLHMRKYMTEDSTITLFAHPILDLHLHDPTSQNPKAMYIYIFSVIGFLVLLIACINFTNVSTFVSLKRSREIGVRKINGGGRTRLVSQFFGETFHQSFAGLVVAMMMVELIRPLFNQLTGKSITIPYLEPFFLLSLAGLLLLTTLLAGIYPALLISAFRPVDAFRGRIITGKGQARFRTFLLVFQFTIAVGLIITTLTIFSQLRYMQSKNLGFEKENLVYLPLDDAHRANFDVFREKLMDHARITRVCRTSSLPSSVWNVIRGLTWEDHEGDGISSFSFITGDEELVGTLGLQVLKGRDFSRQYALDSTRVLVNQEAARMMGYDDAVGKAILSDSDRIEIIGVIEDFHGLPLTDRIEPMLITLWPDFHNYTLIRISPGNPEQAVAHIEKVWKSLYPHIPFSLNFMDERLQRQYQSEIRIGKLSAAFTILAILITCIGLFAIAGHSAQRKYKEIGIRKALGATSRSVVQYFVLIYLKWVLVANAIAWPLSWLLMRNWLNHFAYRTQQGIAVFLLATLISILISVVTIAWHAWNSARTNPVVALKCE